MKKKENPEKKEIPQGPYSQKSKRVDGVEIPKVPTKTSIPPKGEWNGKFSK